MGIRKEQSTAAFWGGQDEGARISAWRILALHKLGVRIPSGDPSNHHTHMCYAEFNDIIEAIARLDADVTIET